MTRLDGKWSDPELDVPGLGRGQQAAGQERDVRQQVVPDVLHLVPRRRQNRQDVMLRGDGGPTTTGCTTATSLRDGAGW